MNISINIKVLSLLSFTDSPILSATITMFQEPNPAEEHAYTYLMLKTKEKKQI